MKCEFGVDWSVTSRSDDEGHLWLVAEVDCDALAEAAETAGFESAYAGRTDPTPSGGYEPPDPEEASRTLAWSNDTCGNNQEDWALWDEDSRVQRPTGNPLPAARENSIVYIAYVDDPNNRCSGVLVHPNWVLTAAHCVDTEPLGAPMNSTNLKVRLGNNKYGGIGALNVAQGGVVFDGVAWNGNVRSDYALLNLQGEFSQGVPLVISKWPDWFFALPNDEAANTMGFPDFIGQPATCTATVEMSVEYGSDLLDVTTHISGRGLVKTRLDGSQGASGSPIVGCPNDAFGNGLGCTTNAEAATVYGVRTNIALSGGAVVDVRGPRLTPHVHDWIAGVVGL